MFFGEQVPQDMNKAIDLATNNADLYMLFQDGHVAACPMTYYSVAPCAVLTRSPTWTRARNSKPGPKDNDAIFTQMTFQPLPLTPVFTCSNR